MDDDIQQIPLRRLIKFDPLFRAWLLKVPAITVHGVEPPWRLYVQREEDGPWARKDYRRYSEAYGVVQLTLLKYYDMTIHSKRQGFKPPVVKFHGKRVYWPCPEFHTWCVYCRRPTIFISRRRHPTLPKSIVHATKQEMCGICGARKENMPRYFSPMFWPPTA